MPTAVPLDDDLVDAARAIADRDRLTLGQFVSGLVRRTLAEQSPRLVRRNGFLVLPPRGAVVTTELVNALRDEEE